MKKRQSFQEMLRSKTLSVGEETLALHLRANNCKPPKREHVFHATRDWRFDFAWPSIRLAVEVEGGVNQIGRHQRPEGFANDIEKYNAAVLSGWRVLRYTTAMVKSGTAINEIQKVLRAT